MKAIGQRRPLKRKEEGKKKGEMGGHVPLISQPAEFYFAMESKKELESLFARFFSPTNVLVNPLGLEFQPIHHN